MRRSKHGLPAAALVLGSVFWLACSSSGTPPVAATLTIQPSTLTVTASGGALAFTATLTGSSSSITWSLTGPGSFSPASGTSTSYTPPSDVSSSTTATLTATAGGNVTASAAIIILPHLPPITVTGTVLTEQGLWPAAGVSVSIGSSITTTDADGGFSLSNVIPPYDVAVVSRDDNLAVVYQALTRTDPTITFSTYPNGNPSNAGTVSGTVSTNAPGAVQASLAWASPLTGPQTQTVTASPFSLNLYWNGAASIVGNLHALQLLTDAVSGEPYGWAYGLQSGVAVANSQTTSNQEIAMTSGALSTITGSVSGPAAYGAPITSVSVDFADGASILVVTAGTPIGSFAYATPAGIGATISVGASVFTSTPDNGALGSTVYVRGLSPDATGVSVSVPEAAVPISPANGATGLPANTAFTWTPYSGGIHEVSFSGSALITIFTAATTTTVPDLSAQGISLGNVGLQWTVYGVGPFATMDEFAGGARAYGSGQFADTCYASARGFSFQ
ncbi:MAG: hypothetical protein ACLQIH_00700 [Myxococcaceae bacterium]